MTDIVQADIFFFVTTFAVIVVTIAIVVLIYNVVKVMNDVRKVVRTVESEVNKLVIKRRKVDVFTLTIQKVLSGVASGALFRNNKHRIDK